MQDQFSLLKWACRRGMLELDTMLQPFFDIDYPHLSDELKSDFKRLLDSSDLMLFRCLVRCQAPEDASLQVILGVIREKHQARHSN